MKKYLLGLMAIVFAGAGSAFITPPSVKTASVQNPSLHWFTADLQIYLGERTVSAQELQCPGSGIVCAKGYEQIDEENETPIVETFVMNTEED